MSGKKELEDHGKLSDDELLQLFGNGDDKAYKIILERYQEDILNYLYRSTNGAEEYRDLAQDVFIELYQYRERVNKIRNFKSWIFVVAVNFSNRFHNENKKLQTVSLDDIDDHEEYLHKYHKDEFTEEIRDFDWENTPEEIVRIALEELSPKVRSVVLLRYQQNLDYEEIADKMDIPLGTVKSRLTAAREQMKRSILKEYKRKKKI